MRKSLPQLQRPPEQPTQLPSTNHRILSTWIHAMHATTMTIRRQTAHTLGRHHDAIAADATVGHAADLARTRVIAMILAVVIMVAHRLAGLVQESVVSPPSATTWTRPSEGWATVPLAPSLAVLLGMKWAKEFYQQLQVLLSVLLEPTLFKLERSKCHIRDLRFLHRKVRVFCTTDATNSGGSKRREQRNSGKYAADDGYRPRSGHYEEYDDYDDDRDRRQQKRTSRRSNGYYSD